MPCSTPVVFLIFRRADLTARVFEAIRQAQPKKLLVVADGPRDEAEAVLCQQTRAVVTEQVDWDCEVLTNFSEVNLGCGKRPATGLDWAFSQVDEAIILEDDCLPTASFFTFCQSLLERYRHDERIMLISGNNFQNGQSRSDYSYYFSKYPTTWGWASWKRAWKHYDYYMKTWPEFKSAGLLQFVYKDKYERMYWKNIFDQMYEDPQIIDAWDYQWIYACWSQSGLAIAPKKNLVSNLGFNSADATHTLGDSPLSRLPTTEISEVSHSPFVVRHREADNYTFDYVFEGKQMREADKQMREVDKLSAKIRQRLSSLKNKFSF